MNILKQLIFFMLSIQEKILSAKLNRTLDVKLRMARKNIYRQGVMLSIDSLDKEKREQLEAECELILKNVKFDPTTALEYVKKQGTNVFYIDNTKYLNAIGENEGFIYPQKGSRALYISFLVKEKPKFHTDEMFIISKGEINKYIFLYHFYNWFMFKRNICGIGADEMALLNKYLFKDSEKDFNKLQLSDIYNLKDAITQDKSAIEFVMKLCREYEGAKNALDKLKENGANL